MSDFPYPGLRPFQRDETDIFFGREDHTDQLIEKLGRTHFIAVVGPSGCGKSSLVRTGLLAGLEMGLIPNAGVHWRIAELRPGNRPFVRLAEALLVDKALGPEYRANFTDDMDATGFLYAALRRGSLSLHEIYKETRLPENTNLLLVVDQFEELFRYYQQDSAYQAAAFVALLLACSRHSAIYVVITMRSDFLGDCALFYDLPEAINQGIFLTPRLTRDQLHDAIEGPANVFEGEIEATLINQLLNDVGNAPDQLPLLQHALMRMWNLAVAEKPQQILLTAKHYERIGGLTTALSKHAEEAYAELALAQQQLAKILFGNLTERGNGERDTRRPVKLEEVALQANVSWQEMAEVVEAFRQADRSFLMPPIGIPLAADTVIDISHESLIRRWQRLTEWTEQEADSAEQYRRLEDSARLWNTQRADLLSGIGLETALVWQQQTQPTAAWAKRYGYNDGQCFDLAMRFLEKSQKRQRRERRHKEALRQREWRRMRRKVAWTGIGLIVMAALALWGFIETKLVLKQKDIVQTEKQRAEQAKLDSQLNNAAWLARFEDYSKAEKVLTELNPSDQSVPTPHLHARRLLNWYTDLMSSDSERVYDGVEQLLFAVAVSPDGELMAAAGENGTLALFDIDSGKFKLLLGHTEDVWAVSFDPNGEWLVSAGDDERIILWSLRNLEPLAEWKLPSKVRVLAISPDGNYLASGGEGDDNRISLWDTQTGRLIKTLGGHTDRISDGGLAFHPSGEWLVSASHDKKVRIWDIKTGKTLHILKGHTSTVEKAIFSPDGNLLATGSSDKTVRLWHVSAKQVKVLHRLLQGHQDQVFALAFAKEGRYLISASRDQTLRLWDTQSGVTLRVLMGHFGDINDIAVHAGKIYSASNDKTIRRWNTDLPNQWQVELSSKPYSVAINPSGRSVVVGFQDGTLHWYSLPKSPPSGEPASPPQLLAEKLKAHRTWITALAFNSDGTLLASGSVDKTAKLWQVSEETQFEEQQTFLGHNSTIAAVAFSPDARLVATASTDSSIGLFTIGSEQKYFYQAAHDGRVYSIAFNSQGNQLLSGGADGYIRVWELYQNKSLWSISSSQGIMWASLSPDDNRLAHVGQDSLVHVYKADALKDFYLPQYSLRGHRNTIRRVIFSPDSQQLATASADSTVRMWWDLSNPIEHHLFTLNLPTKRPLSDFDFRCTPKGRCWMAVPLSEGRLAVYDLGLIYD